MISKNELKYFSSLLHKKYRTQENKFLAEGEKIVLEGLSSNFICEVVFTTPAFVKQNQKLFTTLTEKIIRCEIIGAADFRKLAVTETPQGIIGLFQTKHFNISDRSFEKENIILYLENISEPGNFGTVIRTADWFGIKSIFVSKHSVEIFNPKVVRASMGSVFHLKIYSNVELSQINYLKANQFSFLCADIKGKNIFEFKRQNKFVLALANESAGPSDELLKLSDKSVTIPKLGAAESLNVASAGAVILAQLTSNKNN